MRKSLLALLLALASTASASVPRVRVAVAPAAGTGSAAFARPAVVAPDLTRPAVARVVPLAALSLGPSLAAVAPRLPASAPMPGVPLQATVRAAAAPNVLAAPPQSAPAEAAGPALIDRLREHGAGAAAVARDGGSDAAEANFNAAAGFAPVSLRSSLLRGVSAAAVAVPADAPSSFRSLWRLLNPGGKGAGPGAKKAAAGEDALYDRLLQHLTLDDRGSPEEKAALERTLRTMLRSPTARKYAEEFIAEGLRGVVRFDEVEGSKVYEFDGRKIFYAPRAFTEWKDGYAEVRLNRDYLDSDAEYFREDAPPTLAHELLGHGLWYGRMAKQGLQDLFHIHENNETNAKLVGWLAGWELNKRFHDTFAWEYLSDPARYLQGLKIRQPYYSVTYTTEQMADPVAALEERLTALRSVREQYEHGLRNTRSWTPVIDHFVTHHGVAEGRFERLREDLAQRESAIEGELENLKAIEHAITVTIAFYRSPEGAPGLEVLKSAGSYAEFDRLQSEVDAMTDELRAAVAKEPARPAPAPTPWPKDQIGWDELQRMFEKDAREHPAHWNR
ncbi:MAG: hypothetical protein SF051_03165 [Elusimicrobiota bacterium]|nr:hypothetical protein [Elusimicrobiota bacterium]